MLINYLKNISIIFIIFNCGCSIIDDIIYHPKINQGNYLLNQDIKKIKNGMTKKDVISLIGTPILKQTNSSNIWYYIINKEISSYQKKQKIFLVTFDHKNKVKKTEIIYSNTEKKLNL